MQYTIDDNRLVISADNREREELRKLHDLDPDAFDRDDFMYDMLENLVTNDSFQWIDAGVTGDMTDAPMLAILGDEEPGEPGAGECQGLYQCGRWDDRDQYQPVLYRWAFMNYCVTSPQRDLIEAGEAVFTGGVFVEREGQMGLGKTPRDFTAKVPFEFDQLLYHASAE